MAESNHDKMIRSSAIMGRRGRGSRKPPYGPENDDGPSGNDIVTRLKTQKGRTSEFSFPQNGSKNSKYPANQVTPGKWITKEK